MKRKKWARGEEQEQDRKGDNRKNTEIKGQPPQKKAKNQERK